MWGFWGFFNMYFRVEVCMSQTVQLDSASCSELAQGLLGVQRELGTHQGLDCTSAATHHRCAGWTSRGTSLQNESAVLRRWKHPPHPGTSHSPLPLGSEGGGGSIWCPSVIRSSKVNCLACWSLDLALVISDGWICDKLIYNSYFILLNLPKCLLLGLQQKKFSA